MKQDKYITFAVSGILAFLLSRSAVMCLATGFSLTVDDLPRLTAVCALVSLAGSALFQWRKGSLVCLLCTAFFCGWLWRLGTPDAQLLALVQKISQVYDNAYHWGKLSLSDFPQSADYPLMMLGYLCAGAVSHWSCRGKGIFWAVCSALLPLFACLVVTDTVPAASALFSLLVGIAILLLNAQIRRQSIAQANRLAAMTALPVTAALAVLFLLVPQEDYVNRSGMLRDKLISFTQVVNDKAAATVSRFPTPQSSSSPQILELSSLGPRRPAPYPVMTVTADTSETIYLRGQDYDRYSGTSWISGEDRAEVFTQAGSICGDLTLRFQRPQALRYIPYYPGAAVSMEGGRAKATGDDLEYSFSWGRVSDTADGQTAGKYGTLPDAQRYLALPEQSASGVRLLLDAFLEPDASDAEKVRAIGSFVRGSAEYDLDPDTMDDPEADFVLWFLGQADRGYCVHFATAATVLLRAAGIPARYVTGYMICTLADEAVTVTEENAHAWAEYYDARLDAWLILEATPEAPGDTQSPPAEIQAQTQPTQEAVTETSPSQPAPEENSGEASGPTPAPEEQPGWDPAGFKTLANLVMGLALLVLAVSAQRSARLLARRHRQTRGSSNSQALRRWQEAEFLARLLKEVPAQELAELAQKARFSQHGLTSGELGKFDSYLRSCRQKLRNKPWYIRWIYKYLLAVY